MSLEQILADPRFRDTVKQYMSFGISEEKIVALFGKHLGATSVVIATGGQETEYYGLPYVEEPEVYGPEPEPESTYAPGALAYPSETALVVAGVSWLITQIPLIIKILKILGWVFAAEEINELITGTTGMTTVDDVVQAAIAKRTGLEVGLPGGADWSQVVGGSGDPADYKVGDVRAGWQIKKVTKYEYGKEYQENAWYKPYSDPERSKVGAVMTFAEKCGYYQGMRVQVVTGREAKNRAYKRGFDDGAQEQQEAERASEGGTTPLVRYSGSRRRR